MKKENTMTTKTNAGLVNGLDVNVLKETASAIQNDPGLAACKFRATNKWIDAAHNCTTISGFYGARQEMPHATPFELHADEPPILAGKDQGANPVEHLLNALAGCVTTSIVAHAAIRGIRIDSLESELEGDLDMRGFLGLDPNVPKGYTNIRMKFKVETDPKNLAQLKEFAAMSPVLNTITQGAKVDVAIDLK
jgi:uncharacterized OsmC-like protein